MAAMFWGISKAGVALKESKSVRAQECERVAKEIMAESWVMGSYGICNFFVDGKKQSIVM